MKSLTAFAITSHDANALAARTGEKPTALEDAPVDTGGQVAATISTTRAMVEVAPAMRRPASRLTSTTGDVACALRRVTSPLASQVGYNEEVEKDMIERMAA